MRQATGGFTIIELLVYVGIFSVTAIFLSNILFTTLKVQNKESATNAVNAQLSFVLDTVQRLVQSSSLIECVNVDAGNVCIPSTSNITTGSYLKLRFENSLKDPTCIYLSGGVVKLAEGHVGTTANLCTTTDTASISDLTNSKVKDIALQFTKSEVPGGHAVVQLDASMSYNSTNPTLAVTRSTSSAIGRVSAATFDSALLPNADNSFDIGANSTKWNDAYFGGDVNLPGSGIWDSAGNVGIGTTSPTSGSALDVVGYAQFRKSGSAAPTAADCDSDTERGRLYIETTNSRLYVCNGAARGWDYLTLTN